MESYVYNFNLCLFGTKNKFFPRMRIQKMARIVNQATSAEKVASIDDLLMHILLLLPTRSLLLFKSVSKRFFALITDPTFSLLRNPNPVPVVGLYLQRVAFHVGPLFQYVPFGQKRPENPPFRNLEFTNVPDGLIIVQSCNGLLLCAPVGSCPWSTKGYIFNPKTTQFRELPELVSATDASMAAVCGLGLAFDPSMSPYYNVVGFSVYDSDPDMHIMIYSSKTRKWRKSLECPIVELKSGNAVYWNGSVHWLDYIWEAKIMYFNVQQESLHWMSRPSDWDEELETTSIYLGESSDHLHLTRMTVPSQFLFHVYELKRDYSEWFVKYKVDLTGLTLAYPGMIRTTRSGLYAYSVRTIVRTEREEDSFLVLEIPGKAIRFNLASKTYEKLCDFDAHVREDGELWPFHWTKAFNYIESECFL